MAERRQSARHSRSVEGRIGYAGKYRLRCLILNLSRDGAKIALKRATDIPAEFFLNISGEDPKTAYWVRTKWRRGKVLGVSFTETPAAREPLPGLSRGHGNYRA
jgi:hypothetical protein